MALAVGEDPLVGLTVGPRGGESKPGVSVGIGEKILNLIIGCDKVYFVESVAEGVASRGDAWRVGRSPVGGEKSCFSRRDSCGGRGVGVARGVARRKARRSALRRTTASAVAVNSAATMARAWVGVG